MIFNVEIVVKNQDGLIVIKEPIKNASALFRKNFTGRQIIFKVVSEL
jgi:hypothetical protein